MLQKLLRDFVRYISSDIGVIGQGVYIQVHLPQAEWDCRGRLESPQQMKK